MTSSELINLSMICLKLTRCQTRGLVHKVIKWQSKTLFLILFGPSSSTALVFPTTAYWCRPSEQRPPVNRDQHHSLPGVVLLTEWTVKLFQCKYKTPPKTSPLTRLVEQIRSLFHDYLSHVVRKPAFCICKNKEADQLRDNRKADQHLCFRYKDSTIPLLPKSEISSL